MNINKWMNQIKNNSSINIKIILVGNKSDLKHERVVEFERGKECADQYGVKFLEVSAFNGKGVDDVFDLLGTDILDDFEDINHGLKLTNFKKKKKKCC